MIFVFFFSKKKKKLQSSWGLEKGLPFICIVKYIWIGMKYLLNEWKEWDNHDDFELVGRKGALGS